MTKNEVSDDLLVIEKIKTGRPLFREVVRQIEDLLISGDLTPGDMLPPERTLAERFGVSRTVIREAMKALELRGVVEVQHGRGVQISQPTAEMFSDSMFRFIKTQQSPIWALHELRSILETGIAVLAAERRTQKDLLELKRLLKEMQQSVDDPMKYLELDLQFHRALTEAAHNPLMGPVWEPLTKLMREARRIGALAQDAPRRSLESHRAIVDAIDEQDAEQAMEVMRDHFDRVAHFLLEAESQGSNSDSHVAVQESSEEAND